MVPIRLRIIIPNLVLAALATLIAATAVCAAGKPSRAVSMNAVVKAIRSGASTGQAKSLCGITKLCGYIADADSRDVILLGVADPDLPPLHLDDLVVAMRNVWGVYARAVGYTRYYTDPGCSIDPNPAVMAQLRDYLVAHPQSSMEEKAEAWKRIGSQPQAVRVLGVPFDTRFAKVMVDADYYMKRLANGSVTLGIDGFSSMSEIDILASRERVRSGKSPSAGGSGSMSRFWFSPGDFTYEVRGGATLLRTCSVKLLTEQEYLNEQGSIAGTNRSDPVADAFVRGFSDKYDEIASLKPIYRELKTLFAYVAIARLMKNDHMERTASAPISYLVKNYKLPKVPVSRSVNGLTQVKPIREFLDTPQGRVELSIIQSSCGGVTMSVHPRRVNAATPPAVSTAAAPPALSTTAPPAASSPASDPPAISSPPAANGATVLTHTAAKAPKTRTAPAKNIKRVVLSSRKSTAAMAWDVPVELD